MKIAILDYGSGVVFVRTVPPDLQDKEGEEIAEHFGKELEINIGDCEWMLSPELAIDIK